MGPKIPELSDITAWCSGAGDIRDIVLTVHQPSLLRLGGVIADRTPEAAQRRFSDWLVLPAAGPITHSSAVPRWQMWRIERDIWLPAPYLAESPLMVICEPYAIVSRNREGEIGRWVDWADGLGETKFETVPPKSGQVLKVSSTVIEQFARQRNVTFCWLCQLTHYYREHQNQAFVSFAEQRIYRAS